MVVLDRNVDQKCNLKLGVIFLRELQCNFVSRIAAMRMLLVHINLRISRILPLNPSQWNWRILRRRHVLSGWCRSGMLLVCDVRFVDIRDFIRFQLSYGRVYLCDVRFVDRRDFTRFQLSYSRVYINRRVMNFVQELRMMQSSC